MLLALIQDVNLVLAVCTYLTWLIGVLLCRGVPHLRPIYGFCLVLWSGYSILYAGDLVTAWLDVDAVPLVQAVRLLGARVTILWAVWLVIGQVQGAGLRALGRSLRDLLVATWPYPWRLVRVLRAQRVQTPEEPPC